MNTIIDLNYNNTYKWFEKDNVKAIGYAFFNDKLLETEELTKLFLNVKNKNDLEKTINKLNGAFSIIIILKDKVLLAVDRARTFPLLYAVKNKQIIIQDNIENFNNKENKNQMETFLFFGVSLGNTTLYEDIYQVPTASIVEIDKNYNVTIHSYYTYKYNVIKQTRQEIFKKLDTLYNEAIKKLITYLDGRTAVIPLSGGYDSRLIAYYLHKNNYKNVITFSYGKKDNEEARVSKKIAEYFHFEWHFVEYKPKEMKKIFYSEDGINMFKYYGNGIQIPVFQDMYAIKKLRENNIIKPYDVVVPGYLGDFLSDQKITKNNLVDNKLSIKMVCEDIFKTYGNISIFNLKDKDTIMNNLLTSLNIKSSSTKLNDSIEMIQLFDEFRYKEYHAKYLVNAIRNYDYHNLKWYLCYLDIDLMEFWKTIDPYQKNDRILFKKFVNWLMPDIDNNIKVADCHLAFTKTPRNIISKTINRINIIISLYYKHPTNLYSYFKFGEYLKICLKRQTHIVCIMGHHYFQIINKKNSK